MTWHTPLNRIPRITVPQCDTYNRDAALTTPQCEVPPRFHGHGRLCAASSLLVPITSAVNKNIPEGSLCQENVTQVRML
jgi:hypothetical protein